MATNGRADFPKKQPAHQCLGWALGRRGGREGLPQELRTGSGAQAAPAVVVGGHERAAGGDGCRACPRGLVETSGATPRGPRRWGRGR